MNNWAYLLVWIDTRTGRVTDVGIYSEETPTQINLRDTYATLGRFYGATFAEAETEARRYYAQHPLSKAVRMKPLEHAPSTLSATVVPFRRTR